MLKHCRMSRDYLADLISTTHVFLKLMEHMSKNKHLIVSKKTKKRSKKSGAGKRSAGGDVETDAREKNEQLWETISSDLSAVLQGRGQELPTDVTPFDAASDESMEDQKVTCMKNIQRHLRNKDPAPAVALMRAGREVWPEGDSFGEKNAEPEEEFMALREVLFADLGLVDEGVVTNSGEVGEEEEEDDEEEEDEVKTYSVEQEFNFKAFVFRFAVKNVVMPYGVLFNNYLKNSKETNHHIIKMFHRIAVDCDLPALLFQTSIFRVFQQIWRDLKTDPKDQSLRELAKFSKFILSKFFKVAAENKKVFIELFFWKTSREATEIVEGYGTQTSSAKAKASFWSSEEEERLSTVFSQIMEMEKCGENSDKQGDILDQIELMFSCENRSRRQIGNKLRELGLIQNMKEITKKSLKSSRSWQEEEVEKLRSLFDEFKEAENPGARIHEQWKAGGMPVRSKNKLCEKIVELGWVEDRSKLGRVKKRNRRPKEGEAGYLDNKSDSDSALNDSSSEEDDDESEDDATEHIVNNQKSLQEALESLDGEESKTLKWLAETLLEESKDRADDDFDGEDVPLVTVDTDIQDSMTKQSVLEVFSSLGLCAPSQGEQFWRIPGDLSVEKLEVRAKVLEKVSGGDSVETALEDVDMSLLTISRGFDALKTVKKKKKKEKRNKWLPFRKPAIDDAPTEKPVETKSPRSSKVKNKKFLDSSDDEDHVENKENEENVNPKTSGSDKKTKSLKSSSKAAKETVDVNPFDRLEKLNVDKIKKLLNDDSFTGSDEDDDDEGDKQAEDKSKPKAKKKVQPKKKPTRKAQKNEKDKEKESVSSDDDEQQKSPRQKKKVSKKKTVDSSSSDDEGVMDPTQPSSGRIRAESSADENLDKNTSNIKKKRVQSIESSSDEGVDDPTQPSAVRIKAATSEEDPDMSLSSKLSRTKSNVIESSDEEDQKTKNVRSRSSSLASNNSLDDSRAKSPTQWVYTPTRGSQNSVLSRKSSFDDSRLSRRSSLDDSRMSRSPLSSPMSSRSPSPSLNSPAVKSTPAVKRLREESLGSGEKASKKSRVVSPNQYLNLQLSDSDHQEASPIKQVTTKKKAIIESDSE